MKKQLEHNLELLDFKINVPVPNLLFTNRDYKAEEISFGQRLVLEKAKKLSATAVYFRHIPENQSILPQIFIYDNTYGQLKHDELVNIHRKIWSGDIVPIYYVIDKSQIRIFDAREPIKYNENKQPYIKELDAIELVAEAHEKYQRYSAKLFDNGTFWEQPKNLDKFLHHHGSSQNLLKGLKDFRDAFVKTTQTTLSQSLAHKLLVQAILVKYLEERNVFETNFFPQFDGATNFCEVIRKGKITDLLDALSVHFNGKIFELDQAEKTILQQSSLLTLANFLDANLDNQQYVMWRLYAFDYVPVELISRIYEEFIPERQDAVYTPIHLAQFMVNECMPLNLPQPHYKVIDISCGSGIFLVFAFKRLVEWWQKQRYEQTGRIIPPDSVTLQAILRESIYGVDIESEAIRLSVFSLSLALCDMLDPPEIWFNLKFDNLEEKNLYTGNFFEYLTQEKRCDFDLVIGNPPFKGQDKDVEIFIQQYNLKTSGKIPQKQIALLFLQQAMFLLKEKGLLSLVMPAGSLLYNNTLEYRHDFFSQYKISQIIDFSLLDAKGALFESAVATAVIFALKQPPSESHNLVHVTVKRSKSAKERHFFEIDHYDLHLIPQEIAIFDKIVWKTNLLGGGQLYYLIKRLMDCRTLEDYLENKKKNHGWFYGEGYKGLNGETLAPHLTNKPKVKTENFTEDGILEITIETSLGFESPRDRELFEPPHLLIKETPGNKKFVTAYLEADYLVFMREIIGIHAPNEQKDELKYIEDFLQNNYLLLKMLLLSFSGRAGISRSMSTVLKKDFMALPFPEDETILELSSNEIILLQDMLDYGIEAYQKGEKAYINQVNATSQQLTDFGELLCRSLNTIYQTDGKAFHPCSPVDLPAYICFPFVYGQEDNLPVPEISANGLESLMENKQGGVIYRRVLRLYKQDVLYLIKPKTLRYWLKSIALRDVTDVMQDLIRSGY